MKRRALAFPQGGEAVVVHAVAVAANDDNSNLADEVCSRPLVLRRGR